MTPVSLFLLVLLGRAVWVDVLRRRIPNDVVVGVALLWLTQIPLIGVKAAALAVLVSLLVLAAGIVAWSAGCLGAGDAKLLAALALWAGTGKIAALLTATALSGGILALGLLIGRRFASRNESTTSQPEVTAPAGTSLPYGVAIALGGLWLIFPSAG